MDYSTVAGEEVLRLELVEMVLEFEAESTAEAGDRRWL